MISSNCCLSAALTDHFSESSPAFMHSSTASGNDIEALEVRNTYGIASSRLRWRMQSTSRRGFMNDSPR